MDGQAHDWCTAREHLREAGRLQAERCHSCNAGRTTFTDHETGTRRIIVTYLAPLPCDCLSATE